MILISVIMPSLTFPVIKRPGIARDFLQTAVEVNILSIK